MKLSACMIVKNEEKNITRCIESYKDVVAEIVVVDTGSTDNTVKIAQSMGAKVFHYKWNNHFADAKNFAIDHATGDWIIFLDADEYFVDNTAKNIVGVIKKIQKKFEVIACKIANFDQDSGEIWSEMIQFRIFRRDKNIRYTNSVHEVLVSKSKNKKLKVFLVDGNRLLIRHTGYSLSKQKEKARRNLDLLLREIDIAPEKPYLYQYISDSYFNLENWELAINYARLFNSSGANLTGYNAKSYLNIIASMQFTNCDTDAIRNEITIGINRFPKHPIFRFYLGNIFYTLKRYDAANREYKKALSLQASFDGAEINPMPSSLSFLYYRLGVIAEQCNRYEDALAHYVESLKRKKHTPECLENLLLLIQPFPAEDSIGLLNSIYDPEAETDLEFLLNQLTKSSMPTVLAYYATLRLKKFNKEDLLLLYTLLANGQYDKSFNSMSCYFAESPTSFVEILLVTAGLMSQQDKHIKWLCSHVTPPMQRILHAVLNQAADLCNEDKESYYHLMKRIIILDSREHIVALLRIRSWFGDSGVSAALGHIFLRQRRYREAYDLFMEFLVAVEQHDPQIQEITFQAAVCQYKLQNYKQAIDTFLQAYELGYRENDIYEFLRWSIRDERDAQVIKDIVNENWSLVHPDDHD